MRELLLYIVAPAIVSWFAYRAWGAAYTYVRRTAREGAALALARKHAPFARARAYAEAVSRFAVTAEAPWHREETRRSGL